MNWGVSRIGSCLLFIAMLLGLVACGLLTNPSDELIDIVVKPIDEPFTRIISDVHMQSNCDAAHSELTIVRNLAEEDTVSLEPVVAGKSSIRARIPDIVKAEIEACTDQAVGGQSEIIKLKAEPGYYIEHTLVWEETVVSGSVELHYVKGVYEYSYERITGLRLVDITSTTSYCIR